MKSLFFSLVTSSILLIAGCGDSFYSAQEYLTSPVNGVGLKSSTSIVSGGMEQLHAVVSPPKTENKNVIWASSNSSIVSVDGSGLITGVAAVEHDQTASAVITVTTVEGGYSAQCTVTVREKPVAVTGVTISKSSLTLRVGDQGQLTAEISPSVATNQNMIWTSSSSDKITVDAGGLVTAVSPGNATVTVTTMDGGYKASCFVTSTTDPVYSVSYDGNTFTAGEVPVDSNTYLHNETVTVMDRNTLTKTRYTFAGWNTSSDGSGTTYTVGSTFKIGTANVRLWAVWTSDPTYRVIYDGNFSDGGSVPDDPNFYFSGTSVTVLGNTGGLTMYGFYFAGWYKSSGTIYNAGDRFDIGSGDVTLMAKWLPRHRVIYNRNGATAGDVPADAGQYADMETAVVIGNTGGLKHIHAVSENLESFKFGGWNTRADGTGITYQEGNSIQMGISDITLYAKWVPFVVGDTGPAGGTIFYDKGFFSKYVSGQAVDATTPWRYLEAAPENYTERAWCNYNSELFNDLTEIRNAYRYLGRGYENTLIIVGKEGEAAPAAYYCYMYEWGGYSDWYLPATDELIVMNAEGVRILSPNKYWSSVQDSTHYNAKYYYGYHFSVEGQADYNKLYLVRPVRRF